MTAPSNNRLIRTIILTEIILLYGPTSFYLMIGFVLLPHQLLLLSTGVLESIPVIIYLVSGYLGWYVLVSNYIKVKQGGANTLNVPRILLLLLVITGLLVGPFSSIVSIAGNDWLLDMLLWVIMPIFCLVHTTYVAMRGR